MGFVRLFLGPVDRLIRTGELADTAELPAIEVPEPAVGTALGPVQLRDNNTLAVGPFALPEDLVRADLCTEIASLAPGLVDGEFHELAVLSYNIFGNLYKKPLLWIIPGILYYR
jgi:hypothetical protein